ncbi:MAG TPA: sugar phosphate isomerase/epimerase family protein [Devosiaceae bacterium]|nr:sugar phosphate isomerase/epimerase family protein [Devosiaceae bacterium]
MASILRTGLNPYGLTYYLGIQAAGTPRANPKAVGLEGYIALAVELGAKTLELWEGWTGRMSDNDLDTLGARLRAHGMEPIGSAGLQTADFANSIRIANGVGAKIIRFALTPILCGDRNAAGQRWHDLVDSTWEKLAVLAPMAAEHDITIAIENHQDFTSKELVNFCEESGPNVGIVFDTANTFPVAQAPLDFTRTIAPHVRYLHLKDYRAQWTDEGLRLVRCASGDGAVPFREIVEILAKHHASLPAAIEIGALEARHVRLFTPDWWHGYAPKDATELAACLLAARRNRLPDDADYRTPWERGEDGEALTSFELGQVRKSAENLKTLGLM